VFVVLLLAAPVAQAQDVWPVCPSVDAQHPPPTYPCRYQPAAPKPAGLAQPASVFTKDQSLPVCPSVDTQHAAPPTYPCRYQPAAPKPAGLAQPASAVTEQQLAPCSFSARIDQWAADCR
jgi:hypothetical protein